MRESYEDWQALGRDLIARGLGAPMLIVADGAPGLIKAIEQCWPASDRQVLHVDGSRAAGLSCGEVDYRREAGARSARARASKAAAPAAVQSPSACSKCAAARGMSPRAAASSPSERATGPSLAA